MDDHSFFRAGLCSMLSEQGLQVAGEAGSAEEAVQLVPRRRPDVVVMDLRLPGISGIEGTRQILESAPETVVLVLTVSAREEDVFDAIEVGAAGYLLKEAAGEEIGSAIRASLDGSLLLSPQLGRRLVERARRLLGSGRLPEDGLELSPRELEVLRLVGLGKDNAEIGEELFISPMTVKHHVSSILEKLGATNRVQAAIRAIKNGFI